jgi:hypothetical protein
MRLFEWIKAKWTGLNKPTEIYFTFFCNNDETDCKDNDETDCKDEVEKKLEQLDMFYESLEEKVEDLKTRKLVKTGTKVRKQRVNKDSLVRKFNTERIGYDYDCVTTSNDIYLDYLDWCKERGLRPRTKQALFMCLNHEWRNKPPFSTNITIDGKKDIHSYGNVRLKKTHEECI